MLKKIFAITLIGGSLVLAILIATGNREVLVIEKPDSLFQKTNSNQTENIESLSGNSSFNATEEVAKNIAEKVSNENGFAGVEPEALVDEILNSGLESLDLSRFDISIDASKIKVVRNADKIVAENYFKNLRVIIKKDLASKTLNITQPSTKEDFEKLARAYSEAISQAYKLVVPESLLQIHIEELRLLTMQRNAYEDLASYESDPVKALAAATITSEIYDMFLQLGAIQLNFIAANKLNI